MKNAHATNFPSGLRAGSLVTDDIQAVTGWPIPGRFEQKGLSST
jgi:hypothetical protein